MSVEQDLEQILSARYGKDVRQSIHDAIYEINEIAKKAEYDASTAPESAQAYAAAALAAEQAAQAAQQAAENAAEQAMSGTPAGYDQVVAEVRSLKTNEDTILAQTGTFAGRVLLDKMYGMSVQNGIPTPSVPVDIESAKANFKNCGKNLFGDYTTTSNNVNITTDNTTGTITTTVTTAGNARQSVFTINAKKYRGKKLTFSIKGHSENTSSPYVVCYKNLVTSVGNLGLSGEGITRTSFTFTVANDTNTLDFVFRINTSDCAVNDYLTLTGVQLEIGETATDFSPYQAQSVTTDLTLRALDVTSTAYESYANVIKDGRKYIKDILKKVDNGFQIERNLILNKINDLEWTKIASWDANNVYQIFYTPNNTYGIQVGYEELLAALFSAGTIRTRNSISSDQSAVNGSCYGNMACAINIAFAANTYADVAAFKAALGNEEILYVLKTPTIETVSDTNAKLLLSLKSYDEATYIAQTEDTEGVIVLEYGTTNFATKALSGYIEAEQNSIRISELENA